MDAEKLGKGLIFIFLLLNIFITAAACNTRRECIKTKPYAAQINTCSCSNSQCTSAYNCFSVEKCCHLFGNIGKYSTKN